MHSPTRTHSPWAVFFLIGFAVLGTLLFAAWQNGIFAGDRYYSPPSPSPRRVAYHVTVASCTNFAVTYHEVDGVAQVDVHACPDRTRITEFDAYPGTYVSISAQNRGSSQNRTPFTCRIEADALLLAEVQSVGFASIASCHATVP